LQQKAWLFRCATRAQKLYHTAPRIRLLSLMHDALSAVSIQQEQKADG
jgi:hypothetical protein